MGKYWRASRPYSLPASIVPVLLGTALAKLLLPPIRLDVSFWVNFLLVLIGCVCAQMISNLVNDLAEFKNGFDAKERSKRFNALAEGALTPGQILRFVFLLGFVAAAIGLYLVRLEPGPLIAIVGFGSILAVEYTAPPLRLKYHALGDVAVMLAFGLGMLFGAYIVAGHASAGVLYPRNCLIVLAYALPPGLLVVAILHANNHRDREVDREAGARTVANSLGFRTSKDLLYLLLIGPYALTVVISVAGIPWLGLASLTGLVSFASLPLLLKILSPIARDRYETTVPSVARLHGAFGLLLTGAVLAQILFRSSHAGA